MEVFRKGHRARFSSNCSPSPILPKILSDIEIEDSDSSVIPFEVVLGPTATVTPAAWHPDYVS
jgi:hypothetical protein